MTVRKCIYCLELFDPRKAKPEHILLAALGSEFQRRNIVCSKCNQELGQTIDKSLVEALVFVRNILELPGSRGIAPAIRQAKDSTTGRPIKLASGAKPMLQEPKLEIIGTEPGEKQIKISGDPEFVKRIRKELQESFPGAKLVTTKVKHAYSREPVIIDAGGLGGHDHFRAIAKMAFSFLATQDYQLALQSYFNPVRNYIRYGKIKEDKFLCTLDYRDPYKKILPKDQPHFFNRIAVFVSAKQHNVIASIELFKHVKFLALLSADYMGSESIAYLITNDPLERSHRFDKLTSFPHLKTAQVLDWPSYENVGQHHYYQALPALLNDLMQYHYESFPKRVIQEAIDKYLKKPGKTTITPEDIDKISEYVARQVVFGTIPARTRSAT